MKYLLLLALIMAVIWFLRNKRGGRDPEAKSSPRQDTLAQPQDMVRCAVCSVHLPRSDALPGPDGRLYCCDAHRAQAGN